MIKYFQEFLKSDHWLQKYCILSGGVFYFEPPGRSNCTLSIGTTSIGLICCVVGTHVHCANDDVASDRDKTNATRDL